MELEDDEFQAWCANSVSNTQQNKNPADQSGESETKRLKASCKRRILLEISHDLFMGSWATNIWSGVAVTLVLVGIAYWFSNPAGIAVGFVFGVLILIVIICVAIYRRLKLAVASASRFSIKYTWTHNTKTPGTWFVRDGEVIPLYCSLTANFTNLGQPILIDSYIIKQKCPDGSLEVVSLPHGIDRGIIFMGIDKKIVTKTNFDTFDAAIANRNIGTNETVRGWVFITKMHTARLRFQVVDAIGNVFEEDFDGKASGGWPVQPMGMEITKEKLDISGLKEF